jgi:hypothetical protein
MMVPMSEKRPNGSARHARPSEVTEDYWIHVDSAARSSHEELRCGKWMLFTNPAEHDDVWTKIRDATVAGELGCAAKAATAKGHPLQGDSRALLTCVYTYDYEDLEDVGRVLVALRNLGFMRRISYKTDNDTRAGKYGKGSAIYVAQPESMDFADRREKS